MAVFISPQVTTHAEARPNTDKSDAGAKMRSTKFTTPDITGLVATDTIRLGTLKKGSILRGMKVVIPVNWLAATATIDLGVTGALEQYLNDGVVGAAGVQLDANHSAALLFNKLLTADEELVMRVNTAGAGSAPTGVATVICEFVRE